MDAKTKYEKQSDQFKINVNNIVCDLLKSNILYTKKSATNEAVKLIMNSIGCRERQAKLYLKAARQEILKVTEAQKYEAVANAIKDNLSITPQRKKTSNNILSPQTANTPAKLKALHKKRFLKTEEFHLVTFEDYLLLVPNKTSSDDKITIKKTEFNRMVKYYLSNRPGLIRS